MRQFTFTTLTREEFADFASRDAHGNFQQTTMMADLRNTEGLTTDYVGVVERVGDSSSVVAAALLCTHCSKAATFCSVYDGPLCDFDDHDLTVFFMDKLAEFAKKKHAVHLDITPEQPYQIRLEDGKITDKYAPDSMMMQDLAAAHMQHQGFTRGYTAVPRWRFVKDLTGITTDKELLKSYSKRTQWSIKRAQTMGVQVRRIGIDELNLFASIEQATAERRHFEYRGEAYFKKFAQAFGDDVYFYIAEINTQRSVEEMQKKVHNQQAKVDQLTAKISQRSTTKLQRQLNEETNNLAAAQKRLAEAERLAQRGAVIPVAASMFVTTAQETVYLFSGSVEEYKSYYGSALIQFTAMLHLCVERGVTRYNFYGIDGIFDDPNSEGRGVLEFKQGFNGYVEELPGEFMRVLHPMKYKLMQTVKSVIRKIR